jgi:hypothetical protein
MAAAGLIAPGLGRGRRHRISVSLCNNGALRHHYGQKIAMMRPGAAPMHNMFTLFACRMPGQG